MNESIVISSSTEVRRDPEQLFREIAAGRVIRLPDVGYTIAPTNAVVILYDYSDEAADMVSLRTDLTGVDNTIFVSTKGYAQHAPRIKIAIDPPDSLNAASKTASMAIHDYSLTGQYVSPHIVEQAKQFIERNHAALLDYWDCKIDTAQLIEQLKPPK